GDQASGAAPCRGGGVLKGKKQFPLGSEQRGFGQGDVIVIPGRDRGPGMVPRRHRGGRIFFASPRGLFNPRQTPLPEAGANSPLRLLSPPDRAHVQFAPRCAPRCERGSSLESKHRCRLGGDCANLLRPPRADDHRVTSNRSSEATSIGEKLEMAPKPTGLMPLSCCTHWRSLGDSNPCCRRERATSWAARRREQAEKLRK